jgi:prepilin-type processing-associated H-X9-DG protein
MVKGAKLTHPGGFNVGFVDGSVRFISEEMSPENLRAMITINGNEPIADFD